MSRFKRVPTWFLLGLVLAVLWLFVRGIGWLDPEYGLINVAEEFVIGLGVGLPIAYFTRRMYVDEIPVADPVRSLPYVVVYVSVFLWELVTANLDVAYRVLSPGMPIHPNVVEFPLRVETDFAITTIANSITLTPGTLTMDYDEDRNSLYVHAIDARNREDIVEPIRRWEDYALVIFDERLSPGDPVPDPERVERASGERADADEESTPGDEPAPESDGGDPDGD